MAKFVDLAMADEDLILEFRQRGEAVGRVLEVSLIQVEDVLQGGAAIPQAERGCPTCWELCPPSPFRCRCPPARTAPCPPRAPCVEALSEVLQP